MTIFRPRALLGLCGAAVLIALVPFRGREIAEVSVPVSIGAAPVALSGVVLPPDASQSDEELAAQFSSRHIDEARTASVGSAVPRSAVKSSYASATDAQLAAQFSSKPVGEAKLAGGEPAAGGTAPQDASAGDAGLPTRSSGGPVEAAATASLGPAPTPGAPATADAAVAAQDAGAGEAGLPTRADPDGPVEAATTARLEPARAPDATAPAMQAAPKSPAPAYGSPAAQLYRKGDVAGLAALARAARDPAERLGLEWASLRSDAHPTFAALTAFTQAHPGWPDAGWIRRQQEADLLVHPKAAAKVAAFFAARPPRSGAGTIVEARAASAAGRHGEAGRIIRALWRDGNFDFSTESLILREFGAVITGADHKYRADRLLYAESFAPALRAAALAGADVLALARARIAAARGPLTAALALAVPPALRNDPGLQFARIQDARRSNSPYEAATLLELAPRDRAALINPGRWWSERRMVARQLLDLDEPRLAFELCDQAVRPDDSADQVDAAFHAGWIALRFLGDARTAEESFERAAEAAETPISIARAAYWRGRAAEALGDADDAKVLYQSAASEPIAYYGQLAAKRLGKERLALRAPTAAAEGEHRREAVGAAEALYADGLDDLASALAFAAAGQWRDESQLAAMAEVVKQFGDAATRVVFGKIATTRGYAFDAMAFPSSGVPAFLPLPHSADLASVYAVARQESEFVWHASSGAGAKGLMQLLPATAASTARRAGVAFDYARLLVDPAFNTQLGAAFLGQVMEDQGGSRALAFAAYNAGGGRVAQWIAAHGDPRTGAVDLVDWIERIPFDETRDYVERVSENLGVYRQRLADDPPAPAPISARMARE